MSFEDSFLFIRISHSEIDFMKSEREEKWNIYTSQLKYYKLIFQ